MTLFVLKEILGACHLRVEHSDGYLFVYDDFRLRAIWSDSYLRKE